MTCWQSWPSIRGCCRLALIHAGVDSDRIMALQGNLWRRKGWERMDEMRARLEVGPPFRGNVDFAAILSVVIAALNYRYMRLISWQFLGVYGTKSLHSLLSQT